MAKPKIRNLPDLSHLARPGAEIAVHVTPGARHTVFSYENGTLRIAVTTPPEDGKANEAVRKLLARAMRVAPTRLVLQRGHTSREKVFIYSEP